MDEIDLAKQSVGYLYRNADGGYSEAEREVVDELRAELHTAYTCEIEGCGSCREFWTDEDADARLERERIR